MHELLQNFNKAAYFIKRMMDDGILRFRKSGKKLNTDFYCEDYKMFGKSVIPKTSVIKLLDIQRTPGLL